MKLLCKKHKSCFENKKTKDLTQDMNCHVVGGHVEGGHRLVLVACCTCIVTAVVDFINLDTAIFA